MSPTKAERATAAVIENIKNEVHVRHMSANAERPEKYVMMPEGEERYREFYEQVVGYHGLVWARSFGYE